MDTLARADILTDADHEFFLRHGYVIVKNALEADVIESAVAALDAAGFEGKVGAADYKPVRDAAVDACLSDRVLNAIGELFGPDHPYERVRHASDMPRPYEQGAAWTHQTVHVDDDCPTLMPAGWALGMFIFLTPVRSHGGAFLYAAGSPYRYRPLLADNPEWLSFYTARPEPAGPAQEYLAQPGDVLLFHHLMAHAGSTNVADLQTRHALLARWHPQRRIVPGTRPFAAMSTIEKANSSLYLRYQSGDGTPLPGRPGQAATQTLREGYGAPDGIAAHAVMRVEGVTHLFYVAGADSTTIGHAHSRDWATWQDGPPVEGVDGPVHSLSLFRQAEHILLFAGAGADTPRTAILASPDLRDWTILAMLDGTISVAGHSTTDYGSAVARGNVAIALLASDNTAVQALWGPSWEHAAEWTGEARAATAPPGSTLEDAFVKPILGEVEFALVADATTGEGESRPHYARSRDSAVYTGPLQPLTYSAPTPPRHLRVYARAREYWLVTYTRAAAGQQRLFWGAIDWQRDVPVLEELDSAEALDGALAVVGIV